jgi:hypothetical protein
MIEVRNAHKILVGRERYRGILKKQNKISGSHGGDYDDDSCGILHEGVSKNLTDVSEVYTASIRAIRHTDYSNYVTSIAL